MHEILAADPHDRRLAELRRQARARHVPLRGAELWSIEELVASRTHGGVVARVGPRRYLTLGALLAMTGPSPLLVMLDGVEDPYNFGQAIRALHAAGVAGLIVRPRSWDTAASVVARASGGASELLPMATAASVSLAANACRRAGLRIAGAAAVPDARPLYELDLTGPILIVIGGQRRGIGRHFLADADLLVRVPYARDDAPPLGVATAAAVIGFEACRQRRTLR